MSQIHKRFIRDIEFPKNLYLEFLLKYEVGGGGEELDILEVIIYFIVYNINTFIFLYNNVKVRKSLVFINLALKLTMYKLNTIFHDYYSTIGKQSDQQIL